MVYGNCGVLTEVCSGKGYVEMSGIDPDTSQDIAEVSLAPSLLLCVVTDIIKI